MSESPASQRRSRRRRATITVAAIVGVALAVVAWAVLIAAPAARDQIRVEPRWLACGDEVPYTIYNGGRDASSFDDPLPAFEVALGTVPDDVLCQMEFTIINDGDSTVHVGAADFPAMAPGAGGFPMEVTANGGTFGDEPGASYASVATIEIGEDLEGGSSFDVLVDLRPRRPYPQVAGTVNTIGELPRLHVSWLGVPGTVSGSVAISATMG